MDKNIESSNIRGNLFFLNFIQKVRKIARISGRTKRRRGSHRKGRIDRMKVKKSIKENNSRLARGIFREIQINRIDLLKMTKITIKIN